MKRRVSMSRVVHTICNLLEQGEDLEQVHSPIGTNIGAETPEEIGISIVGELIQARAESNE